jgi:hypothetical protein
MRLTKNQLPEGWTEDRVEAVAEHYERQSAEEALAEFEEALSRDASSLLEVPAELVTAVQSLIEHYESIRAATTRA